MEENYSKAKAFHSNNKQPRDIVIKRILAFSKSYSRNHDQNEALDLLKN
jgi:hypothetical protein